MGKVLITGAAGFTGMALAKHLASRGYSVRGMVRNDSRRGELESLGIEPVIADLNHPESLSRALQGIEKVFHIAALFRQADLPASEFHRVNVEGTKTLLDCAIAAKVRSIIHCSTVGVLGHVEHPPANELTPYNPGDPYQISKTEGEKLFLSYVKEGKVKGTVIRPAMIYGPGDTRTLKLFKRIAEQKFFYVGPGTSLVHFVDVRDLAESFRLASERDDVNGETFIIAGRTALRLKELCGIIASLMGVPEPWLHVPVKPMQLLGTICEKLFIPLHLNPPIFRRRVDFFTKDRSFDCTKAKEKLRFIPSKSLVEEIVDIIESYAMSGMIDRSRIRIPSTILRDLPGHIHAWDDRASSLYGWNREQAIGNVSHALLSTNFPNTLDSINSHLNKKGTWQGLLVHKNKEGKEVRVQSKWKLLNLSEKRPPLVLEVNHPLESDSKVKGIGSISQSLAGYTSAVATSI